MPREELPYLVPLFHSDQFHGTQISSPRSCRAFFCHCPRAVSELMAVGGEGVCGRRSCNTAAGAEMLELCVCVILLLPVSHPKEPSFDFVSFFLI